MSQYISTSPKPRLDLSSFVGVSAAELRRRANDLGYECASLLARPEANPKLAKNGKLGVMSAPLHLAPARLSGYQVCPKATSGCAAACLHTAGNPAHMDGKTKARIARTRLYMEQRELFMAWLLSDIDALVQRASRANMQPSVRLNATSDIMWERVVFRVGTETHTVFSLYPDVVFYDYTKHTNRKGIPSNYTLTFSLAEGNDADAISALENGFNVAAVVDTKRGQDIPGWFTIIDGELIPTHEPSGIPTIDGDIHDFRPGDLKGHIVTLRAKGQAIGDTSGFVRKVA